MKDKVAIRFGHALLKNGLKTSANGLVNEYDIVREFGPYVVNALVRAGLDVVNVTPMTKKYTEGADDLQEGINTAKLTGCKVFVSLHLNAFNGNVKGAECWHDKGNLKGKDLAACIQEEIVKLGFTNRGVKEKNNLAELNTPFTACIVEGFFCDNKIDVDLYKKIGPEKFGQAIANGIVKYINGGNIPAAKPEQKPVPLEKQFRVYGSRLLGNGLTEDYAKTKAQQLKEQGYVDLYYLKPDGAKINYK